MKKMNKKGFTLIEMLVVIAIIAILVAIVIPVVSNATEKAKQATDLANIRSLVAQYQIDNRFMNGADHFSHGKPGFHITTNGIQQHQHSVNLIIIFNLCQCRKHMLILRGLCIGWQTLMPFDFTDYIQ